MSKSDNMGKQVIVDQISASELKEMIEVTMAEQLRIFLAIPQTKESTILTRQQAAEMLGISLPTLHTWTKDGTIQGTRIGTRVRYRLSDVEAALKDIEHFKYRRGSY